MRRRIAIGAAWWLALAYVMEFAVGMYGFPRGVGLIAALPLAGLVASMSPRRLDRPKDRRRLYRPRRESTAVGGKPVSISGR